MKDYDNMPEVMEIKTPKEVMTRSIQTSPYLTANQLQRATIKRLENERDQHMEHLSTTLRGRDAAVVEARLKNDLEALRKLQKKNDRTLGQIAAKLIKAEKVKQTFGKGLLTLLDALDIDECFSTVRFCLSLPTF